MDPIPVADAGVNLVAPANMDVIAVNAMDTALQWIGFENADTCNCLRVEGFDSFDDLNSMTDKDIRDLAESYGCRTLTDGRFILGIRRICYLLGMVHWVQDFEHMGEPHPWTSS